MKIISTGNIYLDINVYDFEAKDIWKPEYEYLGNKYNLTLGGSAVIAPKIMSDLGIIPTFVGIIGKADYAGEIIKKLLIESKISPVLTESTYKQTNLGINATNNLGMTYMAAVGSANQDLDPETVKGTLLKLMPENDLLYIGGMFKLPGLVNVFIEVASSYKKAGKMVVLDHGRVPDGMSSDIRELIKARLIPEVTHYFPSIGEMNFWEVSTSSMLFNTLDGINKDLITNLKLGENGSILHNRDITQEFPPYKTISQKSSVNFVGAGDSYNAGFIYGVSRGMTMIQSASIANQVAYRYITRQKVYSLTLD